MPTSDYTPTVAQVGALLRARTQDVNGSELGTFNDETRPTGEQVAAIIETAVGSVRARFGEDLADDLQASATELAAIRAAMMIELSYFPEQQDGAGSAYDRLKTLYDEGFAAFVVEYERIGVDAEAGTLDDRVAGLPVAAFPANRGGLVGWETVL